MKVIDSYRLSRFINLIQSQRSISRLSLKYFSEKTPLFSKQFKFETFQNASFFQGTVSDLLSRNKIECSIHNVYDSVTVNINSCDSSSKVKEMVELVEKLYFNHREIVNGKINLDFSLPKTVVVPENNQKVQSSYKYLANDKIYYETKI